MRRSQKSGLEGVRESLGAIMVALLLCGMPSTVLACPFCNASQTITQSVQEADVAFIAELSGSKPIVSEQPGGPDGQTSARLLKVLKPHPALEGKSDILLPRYIPAAEQQKVNYLVYATVTDGAIDPYRASPVESKEMVDYLAAAVDQPRRKPAERVEFFFGYLDSPETTIANDAYAEFASAPYKDVKAAAGSFDPERIVGWLENSRTEPYRFGLYGLLLGVCGRPKDADLIRAILEDPKRRPISGVDGLLGGLCVLNLKDGVDYVINVLNDSKNDFNYRYAALRAAKFLVSDLPEVDKGKLFERMVPALKIADISDLVMDEFRRQKQWMATDTILKLFTDPAYDVQVVKRAIVRYALQCPEESAEKFIADLRAKDAQYVKDVEEILRFEEIQQIRVKDPASKAAP
ncbi:hypothetical protein K2X85_09515 [bacterium]|nr:hypothetical protein [bacterium]